MNAAVDGLGNAAGGACGVVDQRTARHAGDRGDAVPLRSDVPPAEASIDVGRRPPGLPLSEQARTNRERGDKNKKELFHDDPFRGSRLWALGSGLQPLRFLEPRAQSPEPCPLLSQQPAKRGT